jgi:tRNA-dihydrouridine synthase B
MAGYTDTAFRQVCRSLGAEYAVTEMVSVQGLTRRTAGTCRLLEFDPSEKPLGVQLYGSEPEAFRRAASIVSGMGFDFVDINAGCPVRKVLCSRSGAALMLDTERMLDIVSAAVEGSDLPVTLKTRLGWSREQPLPEDLAALAAARGAAAIALHGRYRTDMFSGPVDVEGIRRLAAASPVPVVVGGDSTSARAARELRDRTGCTGLMIGRGAVGNPWIFRELSGSGPGTPLPGELRSVVTRHLDLLCGHVRGPRAFHIFRGQLVHYLRGFRGASALRGAAVAVSCREDVESLMDRVEELWGAGPS